MMLQGGGDDDAIDPCSFLFETAVHGRHRQFVLLEYLGHAKNPRGKRVQAKVDRNLPLADM